MESAFPTEGLDYIFKAVQLAGDFLDAKIVAAHYLSITNRQDIRFCLSVLTAYARTPILIAGCRLPFRLRTTKPTSSYSVFFSA